METNKQFYNDIDKAREEGKISLTDWEIDFIDSIGERLDMGRDLSRKQRETLDRIHERIRPW
jgi:hypothetical protein